MLMTATFTQAQPEIQVSVQNLEESTPGTWTFDVHLEASNTDTAFIAFGELVFDFDHTQFSSPTLSVTSLGNLKSHTGNTNLNPGFINFGLQHNSEKAIYSFGPQFVDNQFAFDDGVIALDSGTSYAAYQFQVTGYTGIDDPQFSWIETGRYNENQCQLFTFTNRQPVFETEAATLIFDDFNADQTPNLNLTVFLEGPYDPNTGLMRTDLNSAGYLPLHNPYSGAPWNYTLGDSVAVIPNANVVDWVLVEIRETHQATNANASTSIARRAAFLLNDGSITAMDGVSPLTCQNFEFDPAKKQFVVIYHRNHLPIMAADSLIFDTANANTYTYDFSTGVNAAFGGANGYKNIVGSNPIAAMVAGDASSDGNIQVSDKEFYWLAENGMSGYLNSDYNMNGEVQVSDSEFIWLVNNGRSKQFPQ